MLSFYRVTLEKNGQQKVSEHYSGPKMRDADSAMRIAEAQNVGWKAILVSKVSQ